MATTQDKRAGIGCWVFCWGWDVSAGAHPAPFARFLSAARDTDAVVPWPLGDVLRGGGGGGCYAETIYQSHPVRALFLDGKHPAGTRVLLYADVCFTSTACSRCKQAGHHLR